MGECWRYWGICYPGRLIRLAAFGQPDRFLLRLPHLIEVIVDGRNRFEACRRAGVEPKFERLNGVDVAALILAENVERRNLSAGQRAKGKRTDVDRKSDVFIQ